METRKHAIHNFQPGEIFADRYRLLRRAGSGGFADVWQAEDIEVGESILALKIYARLDDDGKRGLANEYRMLRDINHPNLLRSEHFGSEGSIFYLEMRYCDGGNLSGKAGKMDSAELRRVVRDICGGLAYLHQEGIVHQDIKPENLLYDTSHSRYLLSDFGISSRTRSQMSKSVKMAESAVSMTAAYAPPEKFSSNPADRTPDIKGDMFSLGVTLYELATGMLPVDLPQSIGQLMLISKGRQPLGFDSIADPLMRTIVRRCMSYSKEERPTAAGLLALLDGEKSEPDDVPEEKKNGGRRGTERVRLDDGGRRKPGQPARKANRKLIYGAAAAAAVILAAAAIVILNPREETLEAEAASRPAPPGMDDKRWEKTADTAEGVRDTASAMPVQAVATQPATQAGSPSANTAAAQTTVHMDGNTIVCTVDGEEYRYKMVRVSGGTYTMGCTGEQGGDCYGDEKPARSVTVGGFYIGETEVTQALWKAVMGSNPSKWQGNTLPVEQVSYNDCQEFIRKLNRLTGLTFRLPTEEEWEYAARGGGSGHKYSGSDDIGAVAWYGENSGGETHPVARKQANELGLYDMSGNVCEWCGSLWCDDYNSSRTGTDRIARGGGWNIYARRCRVAARYGCAPTYSFAGLGLRLAVGSTDKKLKRKAKNKI